MIGVGQLLTVVTVFICIFNESAANDGVCTVSQTQAFSTTYRQPYTRIIATYRKCYLFWTCTEYRTTIAYRTATRYQNRIVQRVVCCKGFSWNDARYKCEMDQGYIAIVPPSTSVSPGSNHSEVTTPKDDDDGDFSNSTQQQVTGARRRETWATVTPKTTLFTKSGQPSTTNRSTDKMFEGYQSRMRAPLGAKILFGSSAVLALIIVCSVVAGCVGYRRRKRRLRKNSTNNIHLEPLRDVTLLSGKAKRIKHFRPSFAPADEYAIVDKGAAEPQEVVQESSLIYENADVGSVVVKGGLFECSKQASSEEPHPANGKGEYGCTKSYLEGCYTEVDDSCLVGGTGPAIDQNCDQSEGKRESLMSNLINRLKPRRHNSLRHTYMEGPYRQQTCDPQQAGKAAEMDDCYTEVEEVANGETGNQDVYAVVEDMLPDMAYDHIDREAQTHRSSQKDNVDGVKCVVGRYGVLIQSSSVEAPEEYDSLQRSMSEDGKTPIGYGSLLAQSSQSETERSTEELTASGHCDSYDSVNRCPAITSEPKSKGRRLKLAQTRESATYNRIESSEESDNMDSESPKGFGDSCSEPLYTNQDVLDNGVNDEYPCSTYTDMGGSFGCSVSSTNEKKDKPSDICYTEMAPQPEACTLQGTLLADRITYECPVDYVATPDNCNNDSVNETESYISAVRRVNGGTLSSTTEGNNEAQSDRRKNNVNKVYENV